MIALAAVAGLLLVLIPLWDTYETILLPRRLPNDFRISRVLLRSLWNGWRVIARRIAHRGHREIFLSFYPQLSLIALFVVWALGIILGFAFLHWAIGSWVRGEAHMLGYAADLYLSGTTFFTLGLGDVVPVTGLARFLTVVEAGLGFGFLALLISYVPVLYQSFSPREARITMLDEWAGSPPAAGQILKRAFESGDPGSHLDRLLHGWEGGAATILESHLSYPLLAFFRSQHDNQSWLASLCAVLDAAAVVSAGVEGIDPFQARLTFAIGRHTLVDVSQVFRLKPAADGAGRSGAADAIERSGPDGAQGSGGARVMDRSGPERLGELHRWLVAQGVPVDTRPEAVQRFEEHRRLYGPYVEALSEYLLMPLPGLIPPERGRFNWQTTSASKRIDGEH